MGGIAPKDLNITFKELSELEISGVATLNSTGTIKADNIEINISGSGKVNMGLEAKNVKSKISGVGKMELQGA